MSFALGVLELPDKVLTHDIKFLMPVCILTLVSLLPYTFSSINASLSSHFPAMLMINLGGIAVGAQHASSVYTYTYANEKSIIIMGPSQLLH